MKALLANYDSIVSFPNVGNLMYPGPVLLIGGSLSDFIL